MQPEATQIFTSGVSSSLGAHLEPMAVLPEQEAHVQTAMQVLLTQLELNSVRHYAIHASQQETVESHITIHPEDIGTFRSVCRTLRQVRLVRPVGVTGESQIILEDVRDGKRRYSAIRVIPAESHKIITRELLCPACVSSSDCENPRGGSWHSVTASAQVGLKIVLRGVRAWLRPNGLFCVVLGPDGVGKSTTIQRLQLELQTIFGPCRKERWRPGIIRKVTPDTSSRMPHAKSQRGGFSSTLFVFWLALDFSIGYAISAYPEMARSETIIFDRYFHDLLIDPKRYRYAGPMWLARLISRFMPPRKALFIILDAEEGVILSRKQELPLHELRRQRKAYRNFGSRAPSSMIISTEKPVDEIVAEIIDKILDILASRNTAGSPDREGVYSSS
jgi:thymidylate kinase